MDRVKNGDWTCMCGYINFAQKLLCLKCNRHKITGTVIHMGPSQTSANQTYKSGDWYCRKCSALNFAKRNACFKCNVSKFIYN